MKKCEVCGKENAEIHHIIHKCEGGLDIEINYKYLCSYHHRGKCGPHKNNEIDIKYKLELQDKVKDIFKNEYYTENEIKKLLNINKAKLRKFIKNLKRYKEGYYFKDLISKIMAEKVYDEYTIINYEDFIALI